MNYGINVKTNKPIIIDRKYFKYIESRLICGYAGTGKTIQIKREIMQVLSETEDSVFIIVHNNEYNKLADEYGTIVNVTDDNVMSNSLFIPDNIRVTVVNLNNVSYSLRLKAYALCLETISKVMQSSYDKGNDMLMESLERNEDVREYQFHSTWFYFDEISYFLKDEYCMGLLWDSIKRSRMLGCSVTMSSQSLIDLLNYNSGKEMLANTGFITLLHPYNKSEYTELLVKVFGTEICDSYNTLSNHSSGEYCGCGIHIVSKHKLNSSDRTGSFIAILFSDR